MVQQVPVLDVNDAALRDGVLCRRHVHLDEVVVDVDGRRVGRRRRLNRRNVGRDADVDTEKRRRRFAVGSVFWHRWVWTCETSKSAIYRGRVFTDFTEIPIHRIPVTSKFILILIPQN